MDAETIARIIAAQDEYQTMSGEKDGGEVMIDKETLINSFVNSFHVLPVLFDGDEFIRIANDCEAKR